MERPLTKDTFRHQSLGCSTFVFQIKDSGRVVTMFIVNEVQSANKGKLIQTLTSRYSWAVQ